MKQRTAIMMLASLTVVVGCEQNSDTSSRSSDISSLPGFQRGSYKVAPYLRAAIRLQSMGQEAACRELLSSNEQDQVIVLCRMLFTKRAGSEFRRPRIGGASFFGDTDYGDWTSEPIELVGGVPFLITNGYTLDGIPETAEAYLRYCMKCCDWNAVRYGVLTDDQTKTALAQVLSSPKWKRPLHPYEMKFLSAQIR